MKAIQLILTTFSILLLASCNQEKDCTDGFKNSYSSLQDQFSVLYTENVDPQKVDKFRSDLTAFNSEYGTTKCKLNGKTVEPGNEVRSMMADLGSTSATSKRLVAKVIYGDDDRTDVGDHANSDFQNWARASVAMVEKTELDSSLNILSPTLGERMTLCPGERFENQLSVSVCTGFLVAPDLVVTAGHCMQSQIDCNNFVWVFDFVDGVTRFDSSKVYSCKEIVSSVLDDDNNLDYAVVRLDRAVTDRKFLRLRSSGSVERGDPMVIIGNPSGIPTKIADNASVRSSNQQHYFVTDVDSFGGNSGSAVFNERTGTVEGILVRGETDYIITDAPDGSKCRAVNVCSQNGCDGEEATRITSIEGVPFVQNLSQVSAALKNNSYGKVTGVGAFKFYSYQFYNWSISGRKFLDICGVHVHRADSPGEWEKIQIGSCAEDNSDNVNFFYSKLFLN